MEYKIRVLRLILEHKSVLFGGFASNLTKADKREKWIEITRICHSLGIIPAAKNYAYVRDTYWPNIKKATMAKVDNSRQTGSAGGREKQLTAVDELVLQILGNESPTVVGLNVPDIMENIEQGEEINTEIPSDINEPVIPSSLTNLSVNLANENNTRRHARRNVVTHGSRRHAEIQEYNDLKKRKIEEDIKTAQLTNYKLELEIYEQELKLNIAPSQFTKHISSRDPLP